MYRRFLKRPLDFILALIALIVLSPLLLLVGALVRIKIGSPVLFRQPRPGRADRIFTIYKYRTMTDACDGEGRLLPDCVRLTKFGKVLRSTSLDELPEFFNILTGEMSFVGPRPQLVKDLVFFSEEQQLRQAVRPGLTGLAQIKGRNAIRWEDKLRYDLEYIADITFRKDCQIILKTFTKVFTRDGIASEGMATAEDFGDYLLRTGAITADQYRTGINKSMQLLRGAPK